MQKIVMLAQLNSHPRDQDITFQEDGHIYTIRGDKYYKSCTTWLKSFFEKFNADAIIDKMMDSPNWTTSKYFGMTKQEIKDSWSENGKRAAEFGTNMHKHIEEFYNGNELPKDLTPELHSFVQFYTDHLHLTPFRTEMMIYDEDIRICGSVDMLFQNKDGTLSIYDWKFAKEIQTHSYGKKGLHPVEHLNDCNTVHYALQLNLYREILERKYGYVIQDMNLVFMHRDLGDTYIKYPVSRMDMTSLLELRLKPSIKRKNI
jgi:ATP-dependent exoDNAse (exonuclease V) beta subunit